MITHQIVFSRSPLDNTRTDRPIVIAGGSGGHDDAVAFAVPYLTFVTACQHIV